MSNSGITDVSGDSRTNFYLGTTLRVRLAKWYALQPELNYSRQGMEARFLDNFDPVAPRREVDWNLDYLGLTLNNKFYVAHGLNLQVGPYLDFVVNNENVNPTNDVDTGLTFGIGYDFPNGLGVETRFRSGFVDVFEDYGADDDFDNEDNTYLNVAIQIGITYTFDLNKK